MKKFLFVILFSTLLSASTQVDVKACKKCHPIIAKEFAISMHKRASIDEDKIHKAFWNIHPLKAKNNYICAKCHTPDYVGKKRAFTCLSCHAIIDIQKHKKSNKNIYSKKPKTFYSAQKGKENQSIKFKLTSSWLGTKKSTGSAYHTIDYTHENFYTGEVCMGCHSHKQNGKGFTLCVTDESGAKDKKENCITCHMPKIDGSATTVRITKKHAFHGFAGLRVSPKMLSKYITLDLQKREKGFEIIIKSDVPHLLLTHPARILQLKSVIIRGDKRIPLKKETFVKINGTNKRASLPWLATEVVKNNMIKAKEKRVIPFKTSLKSGDRVEVTLGFYLINPKLQKKLHLMQEKELVKFTTLTSHEFFIK